MRPSGHIHSATIALLVIIKLNPSIDVLSGALFLIGVMLLDGDFIITKTLIKIPNHRDFPTHNIFLYMLVLPIAFAFNSYLFWLFCGAFYHLLFDLFDWGLPLKPTSIVTPHVLQVPENKQESYFFKIYFSDKSIQVLEIILFSGFLSALMLLTGNLVYLIAIIEFFVILEFVYQLMQAKKLGLVHF